MRKKLKSEIIIFFVIAFIMLFLLNLIGKSGSQKSQYLDNLDYNITINEDGVDTKVGKCKSLSFTPRQD